MQGTGNINYSFDKTKFNTIFTSNSIIFYPFYIIITLVCFVFPMTLYYQKDMYKNGSINNVEKNTIKHYFNSITLNSPLNIMSMDKQNIGFIGLDQKSYIILISIYVIAYLYLLQGVLKNLIYSFIVNIIQANPNNNPYNNVNCIIKNKDNPNKEIISYYISILLMTLFFLIPFLTPMIFQYFDIDNYSIKHSYWLPWLILFILIFPFFIIVIRHSGSQKLDIIKNLNNYLDSKDHKYTSLISSYFDTNYSSIFIFIFVILVFTLLKIVYYTYNTENRGLSLAFIIISLFILIPGVLIFFSLNTIFGQISQTNKDNNIEEIEKKGISNLYQLIVKYNYPCFKK
jgi:hypothetical protein